ncbi:MAG: DUF4236 domain-containing protein [Victivallales bacterium]|nr:DUF4236 domain-containing protein [Victivallales bacterium]
MGFRFQKRIKIFPGVSINLSKGLPSVSVGPRGAKMTLSTKGVRGSVGLPGTGASYSKYYQWGKMTGSKTAGKSSAKAPSRAKAVPVAVSGDDREKLNLGFFRKLFLSAEEKHFVTGLTAFLDGDAPQALAELNQANSIADAAFTRGFLALSLRDYTTAAQALQLCAGKPRELGKFYDKYGLSLTLNLDITDYLGIQVRPGEYALLLGQVEVLQATGQIAEAEKIIDKLLVAFPGDLSVMLSAAELALNNIQPSPARLQKVLACLVGLNNDSNLHAWLLLYKAEIQSLLGTVESAVETLTLALRRKVDREPELLLMLRYARSKCYRQLGKQAQADKDLETLRGENPAWLLERQEEDALEENDDQLGRM